MKFPLVLALLFGSCPAVLGAPSAAESYATALAAEKGAGDPEQAAVLYQELLEQYHAGQIPQALGIRARQRLAARGVPIPSSPPAPLPFQALGERLGMTPAERLTAAPPAGILQVAGVPLRPRYLLETRERDHRPAAAPDLLQQVEQQIRALRYALGITGLLEYVEAIAGQRQPPRVPGPDDLYQQGLFAECQEGDLTRAAAFYQQALAAVIDTTPLHHQLTRRRQECQENLARRGEPR